MKAVLLLLASTVGIGTAIAQDLPSLVSRFQSEHDRATKESILLNITQNYPQSGAEVLRIARQAKDNDTTWLAIRGIGYLKFHDAAPFLKQSLGSESPYVRANAARALGEIHDTSATPALISLLKTEQDSGVIEQSALALQMLDAKAAVPVLKDRVANPSAQTRIWILGAIEVLDTKKDVPFFATFLSDKNDTVAAFAAHVIERFTSQDFGFPKCGEYGGPCSYGDGVNNARSWWNAHKQEWAE